MGGSPESIGDNVVISLSRKEGRKAKLACMKEKEGEERYKHIREAEKEFSRAFDENIGSYYDDTRFTMSPRAATAACRAIEINGPRDLSRKVRHQIAMQGVVLD